MAPKVPLHIVMMAPKVPLHIVIVLLDIAVVDYQKLF